VKVEERKLARIMRRDAGLPIRLIAERLGVAKSSVSRWVRDIELTPEQHAVLRAVNHRYNGQLLGQERRSASARTARLAAQEHGRKLARRGDALHLQGCMLYWAEGSKKRNCAVFTNSDPEMVRLFVRFLRHCYAIADDRIAMTVNCYLTNGLSADDIVKWWLHELELPDCCVRTPVINRVSSASRSRRGRVLPYGTVRVAVCSMVLVQSIFGAIQEYGGFERPAWLDQL
jgi:transcriptional regulator with XRE-family HTH domain